MDSQTGTKPSGWTILPHRSATIQTERLSANKPEDITRAASILREGGTVAFPTETVYGLGASALSPEAVEKIFVAKQRPHWDPLIVHIADPTMLAAIATPGATATRLMARFWPGPLTLLLPRTSRILDIVTAGRPLVGVRMPAHPVALELIRQAGVPIAAPSANTFGHTSPTTAAHVLADLDGRIDAVLDGGPAAVGVESTVAGIESRGERSDRIVIYRDGAVDEEMLWSMGGVGVGRYVPDSLASGQPDSLPSPGVGIRHYAPRASLLLAGRTANQRESQSDEAGMQSLIEAIDACTTATSKIGVLLPTGWNPSAADLIYPWGPWHEPEVLASRLYAGLRQLDDAGATHILCPVPEGSGIAEAIRDRLQKAARS